MQIQLVAPPPPALLRGWSSSNPTGCWPPLPALCVCALRSFGTRWLMSVANWRGRVSHTNLRGVRFQQAERNKRRERTDRRKVRVEFFKHVVLPKVYIAAQLCGAREVLPISSRYPKLDPLLWPRRVHAILRRRHLCKGRSALDSVEVSDKTMCQQQRSHTQPT